MTIGEAIKFRILYYCNINKITVNKLGTICGITPSTIRNIIGGRNKSMTILTIKEICDGLGITISEFFDDQVFNDLEETE